MDKKKIPKESGEISRREFVAGAGAVVVGGVVGGVIGSQAFPKKVKPWLPDKWDKEADIVVLGQGAAGMITAITGHDLGAEVLILEKAPEEHAGGNTLCNWGDLLIVHDPETMFKYLKKLNWGTTPDDVVRAYLERLPQQENFYKDMGLPIDSEKIHPLCEFPEVEGGEASLEGRLGHGGYYMEVFTGQLKNRGIEVLFETPAKKLIQDAETKEILGVIAEHNGKKMYVKAKKAVVICTGGFSYNEEMILQYIGVPYIPSTGSPYDVGDGILMAQDVGADLCHMCFYAGCGLAFLSPDYEYPMGVSVSYLTNKWFYVDRYGNRYMNEVYPYRHGFPERDEYLYFDPDKVEYSRIPSWLMTDETGRTAGRWGPVDKEYSSGFAARCGYQWSEDNSVEVAKGWILKGDTISDLAVKMHVTPAVLTDTVTKWNRYCEEGEDLDFGRDLESMGKIETPPYYAIELRPSFTNTLGGPKRNAKSQIVDTRGKPIPRLYLAGECGSVAGFIYQSSENMAECFAFGQISGENAVKEVPWT